MKLKKILALIAVPVALSFAQTKPAEDRPSSIPAGAKQVAPYTYTYVDTQGKKWSYRQTPFGIMKSEAQPEPQQTVVVKTNPIVAIDLGETVKFQRQTPFGMQSWTKKKSELTDDEKSSLAASSPKVEEKH